MLTISILCIILFRILHMHDYALNHVLCVGISSYSFAQNFNIIYINTDFMVHMYILYNYVVL